MSGHKRATVTISQEEYRRLYDAEKKNVYSAIEVPWAEVQSINQQTNHELVNEVNNLSERQDRYINTIKDLNNKVQDLEYEASKSLVDQQLDFYNKLSQTSENIWRNAEQVIQMQSNEINQQIISQHDRLQNQILQLENRIARQNKSKQNAQDASARWIQNSLAIGEFIRQNYVLTPEHLEEFSSLENQLEIATANFHNQFYEACLSSSQQVFSSLTKLRLRIEKNERERKNLLLALDNHCQVLVNKIAINQTCKAIDLLGNILDEELVVDDWVDGKLSLLHSEIVELANYVASPECNLSNDELSQYLKHFIANQNQHIEDLIRDARYYALNSQLRFNIAQQVMLSLVEQGFRPVEGGFLENNYNGQYTARAINHDGGEVTVTIDPDASVPLKNEIHIVSNDQPVLTAHELRQRSHEIRESLVRKGLEVSNPVEVGRQGTPIQQRSQKDQRKYRKINP